MTLTGWLLAWAAVGCAAAPTSAPRPAFRIPLMKSPPKIDGRIDPAEWALAAGFDGLGRDGGVLCRRRARAYVGATETHLYFALASQLPDEGALLAAVERDSLKAVYDDAVEVFVNPSPGRAKQVEYQLLVNSRGRGGYQVHTLGAAAASPAWRGGWKHAHGLHAGAWHFECAVPVASLPAAGAGRKTTDGTWAVNLTRDWKQPWEWSSLAAAAGGYAFTAVPVVFDPAAPAVQQTTTGEPFLGDFTTTLTVRNPTGRAMSLNVSAVLTRDRMPAIRAGRAVRLAPGEAAAVPLKCPRDEATTRFALHLRVADADGRVVYYDRRTSWPRGRAWRYVAAAPAPPAPVACRFAYYPYRNRMRLLADINGLPAGARLEGLTVEVRERLSGRVVRRAAFDVRAFRDGRAEIAFDLPPLEGLYELALLPRGEGLPAGQVVRCFERKVFPWEHTPAGRSTKVYPPFTPIALDAAARTLRTVLRTHRLNDLGLWDQVTAASAHTGIARPVLAAPMRYVARVGGRSVTPAARPLAVLAAEPHRAVTDARFSLGGIPCTSRGTWDYDGTMKVELTVGPTGGRRLDELTLEIPFAPAAATLIHANADRIRAPVAGRVPPGEGVVWDASKVACDEMPRGFCPYVYVGDAVRGICWFADNDLGWHRQADRPNLTLARSGGAVVLRVHLVDRPLRSDRPRKITFGLLAAPVKPRLAPGGRHGWRYRYLRDRYTLLGTDINWLARGNCGSVYPAGRDLYLWEMIARGNRTKLPPEEIEKVVAHGRRYFRDDPDRLAGWAAHVRHNLRSRYGQKMVFYYNRASCQLFEEFETFKDEWSLTDFRSVPKGRGTAEIKIVPSESYIDHALYWYARSFEVGGNAGVYWDNFYIAPSFNTAMTDAYRAPDGKVVPAAGIWALRELARRTFVMMNERGMLPVTFAHMTSFSPLPMLAFCTVQYDWEWKYSLGDVQDRHGRELILLTSTGELAGTWPVPLADHGRLANDPWTQRTFTAARLVHELDGYGGFGLDYNPAHRANRPLFAPIERLLDEPTLKVYRYWDERPSPVRADSPDVPTIVYSVPAREAVAAVASYADRDLDVTLRVDLEALGLAGGCRVTDAVTGRAMKLAAGRLTFPLRKHDVRVFRFRAGR